MYCLKNMFYYNVHLSLTTFSTIQPRFFSYPQIIKNVKQSKITLK